MRSFIASTSSFSPPLHLPPYPLSSPSPSPWPRLSLLVVLLLLVLFPLVLCDESDLLRTSPCVPNPCLQWVDNNDHSLGTFGGVCYIGASGGASFSCVCPDDPASQCQVDLQDSFTPATIGLGLYTPPANITTCRIAPSSSAMSSSAVSSSVFSSSPVSSSVASSSAASSSSSSVDRSSSDSSSVSASGSGGDGEGGFVGLSSSSPMATGGGSSVEGMSGTQPDSLLTSSAPSDRSSTAVEQPSSSTAPPASSSAAATSAASSSSPFPSSSTFASSDSAPPSAASSSSTSISIPSSSASPSTTSPSSSPHRLAASTMSPTVPSSSSASSSSSLFSSSLVSPALLCTNHSGPSPPNVSSITLIPTPFNTAPLELLNVTIAFLTCNSSSYITLYSLLYSPSFPPFNATSPYMFAALASFNFSLATTACPAQVTFSLSEPLAMDGSHTLAVFFSAGTQPSLIYTGGASTYLHSQPGQQALSSTLSPAQGLLTNFSFLTSSSVLSVQGTCPAGKYVSTAPGTFCLSCAAGTYLAAPSTFLDCFTCPPGTWSSVGALSCTACVAGYYQPNWAASSCASCPAGYTSTPGSSSCAPCPLGFYSPIDGSGRCSPCPIGFYADAQGTSQCTACPSYGVSATSTVLMGSTSVAACTVNVTYCATHPTVCPSHRMCVDSNVPGQFSCVCAGGWTGVNCSVAVSSSSSAQPFSSSPSSTASLLSSSPHPSSTSPPLAWSSALLDSIAPLSSSAIVSSSGLSGVSSLLSSSTRPLLFSSSSQWLSSSTGFNASCPCFNASDCVGNSSSWSCVCSPGFTGSLCERCSDDHYSPQCLPCTDACQHGQCDDGMQGSGSCVCANAFTGSDCSECESGCFGPNCIACPLCEHGVCEDGLAGSGTCNCSSDWTGSLCQFPVDGKVVTLNIAPDPVYLPSLLSSFIVVQLEGAPAGSSFYSRIDSLPAQSSLWQTNDGITPLTLISTASTTVADKLNRVLWQPPQIWQSGRTVDSFTYSMGSGTGGGYSASSGTATLTVIVPPPAPTVTVPETLLLVTAEQLLLSGVVVQDSSGDVLELLVAATTGRVTVDSTFLTTAITSAPVNDTRLRGWSFFSLSANVSTLNAALSTLTYFPGVNASGPDSVSVTVLNQNTASELMPPSSSAFILLTVAPPAPPPQLTAAVASFLVTEYGSARVPAMTVVDPHVQLELLAVNLSCSSGTLSLDVWTVPLYAFTFPAATATSGSSLYFRISLPRLNLLLSNLSYTPSTGFSGVDSVRLTIAAHGSSSSLALQVSVSHVNRPGSATPLQVTMVEDGRVIFALNSSSLDEDPTSFTYVVAAPPPTSCGRLYQVNTSAVGSYGSPILSANSSVTDSAHRLLFILSPYVWGSPACSMTYFAQDQANVTVSTSTATVTFVVSHVNHAPVASSGSAHGFDNEDLVIALPASDPDGDALLYYVDAAPSFGSLYQYAAQSRGALVHLGEQVTDAQGRLIYAPQYGQWGNGSQFDAVAFAVSDGQLMSAADGQVAIFIDQRVAPLPYDWAMSTNLNTDAQLTFHPHPLQLNLFNLSQVVIAAPTSGLYAAPWSLYSLDPATLLRSFCSLPCTVPSIAGAAPTIFFSPAPNQVQAAVLSYQSYNGPVYTALATPNSLTVQVMNVTTGAPSVADVEWCLPPGSVVYTRTFVPAPLFSASTTVVRINSLPSRGDLRHHDADTVTHPAGQFIHTSPTNLTTNDSSVDWQLTDATSGPYATSFTYSLAHAPLYMFSPPATVRLYLETEGLCDVVPVVDAQAWTLVESEAVTITLTGAGFDAWTVNITALPVHGQLFQANGSLITNATLVTDPFRRVVYLAALVGLDKAPVQDWFGVQGFSIKGAAGPVAAIAVSVSAVNTPPVASSAWYFTNEDSPLLITLQGWDVESNSSLDAVVTSLPATGYLYIAVNGSAALNELIYSTPYHLPAAYGVNGRAQVWFVADSVSPFSLPSVSDVYASFQFALVDAEQAQSMPATVTLTVEEVHVGPSVANVAVPVPPVVRSLIALSGEGDNAPWWAVVLTLPAGTLLQVEEDGSMGAAITAAPAVVSHTQHLLLYQPCAACGANDTFMYAAQSSSTIAYSNVTIANNASSSSFSSSSSSSSSSAGYVITSSSSRTSNSFAEGGMTGTSSAGLNSSGGATSSSPSSPSGSASGSSGSSGSSESSSEYSFGVGSSSGSGSSSTSAGDDGGGDTGLSSLSSLLSAAASGSASSDSGAADGGNLTSLLSSSSSLNGSSGSGNSTASNSSSGAPYVPRHYTPVITNLSATATATLLFTSPLPSIAQNVTLTLNESTTVNVSLPASAILTQLPFHGSVYHACLQLNDSECPIHYWDAIDSVPTPVQGDGIRYEPASSLYGLEVNDWVLDYVLYQQEHHLPASGGNGPLLAGMPPPLPSPQPPSMVSFAVIPVLQAPQSLPGTFSGVLENGNVLIKLTYISESDPSTLHAHIVRLPQHGRLCQLVNVSQCGEVMYPPANGSLEGVDEVVQDADFQLIYQPDDNWSGVDWFTWLMEDSFGHSKNQANISLQVSHVNQPPVPFDVQLQLTVDSTTLLVVLNATDPDQSSSSLSYAITEPPAIGTLNQTYWNGVRFVNELVIAHTPLRNQTLLYSQADMASDYPFPSFKFSVTDVDAASATAVVSFDVSCPPGLVNNVFLTTGPLCIECPLGADCSQSGTYSPFTQTGYWPSDLNRPDLVVYLTCQPAGACGGGPWDMSAESLCTAGYSDRRCGSCANGYYKINGACSSCPTTGSFWLTVMVYVLPSGAVLGLSLLLISRLGLEVTFFTIAINFFQLLSTFSQFNLNWPSPAHTLFSAVSFINFNVDLLSLECHFPGITYQEKWLSCILFPVIIAILMLAFSYSSALVIALAAWWRAPRHATQLISPRPSSPCLSPDIQPTSFAALFRRQLSLHQRRFIWAYHTFLVVVFLSLALKSFEMLKCTTLADGTQALDVEPSIRCDVDGYIVWRDLAILSVCFYVIGIPLWLAYVMFRLRPPVDADPVWGGWLHIPRTRRRAEELRRQKRLSRRVGGEEEYRLQQRLDGWSRKYSTLTRPFSEQYYYWSIVIILRNLIVAVVSIVCTTIPLYQACLTLLTLAMAVLLQQSRKPYRLHTGMNELEQSSLSTAILILFLGILFFAELGSTSSPSDVLSWLVLSLVFTFSAITIGLFLRQLLRIYRNRHLPIAQQVAVDRRQLDAVLLARMQRTLKVKTHPPVPSKPTAAGKEQRLALYKGGRPLLDSGLELASLDRSLPGESGEVSHDSTSDEGGVSSAHLQAGEHKKAHSESDIEMTSYGRVVLTGEENKADADPLHVSTTASAQLSSPPSTEDSDESRAEGEETVAEGSQQPLLQRVQMITSPFPAPLTLFSPPLVKSDSKHQLSALRAESQKREGGGANDDDPQVFVIDHSHIPPIAAAQPTTADDPARRHRTAAAKWSAAITAVRAQLRERRLTQSRQEVFVIRGAMNTSAPATAAVEADVDVTAPAVFRLKTRPGGSSEQRPTTASSSSASSSSALSTAAPWPRSSAPPARLRVALHRRPSLSVSSSFAAMDSQQSEVSMFSTLSDSAPHSPHSPRSQSHFVIPPAALRHEVQPTYHHRQQSHADLPHHHPPHLAAHTPLPAQGVTLLLSDDLQRAMSHSGSGDSDSHSGLSELSL